MLPYTPLVCLDDMASPLAKLTAVGLRVRGEHDQAVQRTGASRFVQRQIKRQRRLAPVADLCV